MDAGEAGRKEVKPLKLLIEKNANTPKYLQVAEHLQRMIETGELKDGERLPAERDLGKENEIARGTIQMAYQELIKQGKAFSVRGSGTYIRGGKKSSKEVIVAEVEGIFDKAARLGMDTMEVVELFRKSMVRHMGGDVKLMTAWVDCNPEALLLARNEFENVENNSIHQFILDDVLREPKLLSSDFELIVTTTHHYETLKQAFPELTNKIEVVTMVPSRESIVELAQIQPSERVVFWSISRRFMENILWQLREFKNVRVLETFISDRERERIEMILKKTDVLIVSREYRTLGEPVMLELVERYRRAGGKVLEFTYEFDEGSLLHLQTRIYEKIEEKEKHMFQ